ncbi:MULTISPECIES: carbohydrate kinase [unclassified Streptomyces]|uniref:carbohydrate kinase family protein n=1 Tax=unclassified Streptomyces TaxID=2593676 RepID=UPI00037016FC|nr:MULTISPECIES: carbohydrate kinase [unclassified Streptomyces]MYX36876.1 carbohydrate kinase [Streptomyces sp. SID8377]
MQPPQVTVIGECVADAFPEPGDGRFPSGAHGGSPDAAQGLRLRVLPGGGPANTAVGLARLGTPTRLLARLSGDVFGRLFRAHLLESGVDLSAAPAAPEPSTLAVADVDGDGQAAYSFHAEGTADWQWTREELGRPALGDPACVHSGSLALVREPGAALVEEVLAGARRHATVSIDPNVRPALVDPRVYRDRIPTWCATADILRLSEDDLAVLAPGTPPEEACDGFHAAGARLVVVTRGARGVLASLDGRRISVPGVPARVVDTVGAGDSFTAGLLHHLGGSGLLGGRLDGLRIEDVTAACAYAARVAALTCAAPGPNPPWAHQVNAEEVELTVRPGT